jgi:soluble lytic murein transglycosylase-like protein
MLKSRKLVALAWLILAIPASAADLAILHNGFSIRHERREIVGSVTRLYLTADPGGYVDIPTAQIERFEIDLSPPAAPTPTAPTPAAPALPVATAPTPKSPVRLDDVIHDISDRHHLDPDLVNSVIHAESGFNPHAVSPKGARGLMQLMPQTASNMGVSNAFDPSANVEGGTRYLRELLERYNFDLVKALAAYNAGPERVEQYHGVPPYRETRSYVARIVRDFNRKKLDEGKAAKAKAAKTHPAAKGTHAASTVKAKPPDVAAQASR